MPKIAISMHRHIPVISMLVVVVAMLVLADQMARHGRRGHWHQ